MKKIDLIKELQDELDNLYHNATIHYSVHCQSDYEADLLQSEIEMSCQIALDDIGEVCPDILNYGEVYQYGRGGRTLAPDNLIRMRGGSSFSIKNVDDLELNYLEMRKLLKTLRKFNKLVNEFCSNVVKHSHEFITSEYSEEIENNKNKKRQHYSGVRYV
jgi:hypothetical protein